MLKLTSYRLRLAWYALTATIALLSILRGVNLHGSYLGAYVDRDWAHFLAYAVAATLPLLVWRRLTGLALSFGLGIFSVVLQILRALISDRVMDLQGTAVNLLGIVAGILLGLNILTLQSRARHQVKPRADRSHPTLL
jgi:hypothetical protein